LQNLESVVEANIYFFSFQKKIKQNVKWAGVEEKELKKN